MITKAMIDHGHGRIYDITREFPWDTTLERIRALIDKGLLDWSFISETVTDKSVIHLYTSNNYIMSITEEQEVIEAYPTQSVRDSEDQFS